MSQRGKINRVQYSSKRKGKSGIFSRNGTVKQTVSANSEKFTGFDLRYLWSSRSWFQFRSGYLRIM